MKTLVNSFADYILFNPTTSGKLIKKSDVIENFFFKSFQQEDPESPAIDFLKRIKVETMRIISESHLNSDTRNVGHLALCLTNLLSY